MRHFAPVIGLALLASSAAAHAADQNGYTAQYECRAGNPRCNVDIQALVRTGCDQIVRLSDTNWDKITRNSSSQYFCIEAGNHTSKGPLEITFSGSPSARKVLRYYGNDASSAPWHQADSQRAKVAQLTFGNADYWVVHRITIPDTSTSRRVAFIGYATDIILDRMLIEGVDGSENAIGAYGDGNTPDRLTVQNSVIRNNDGAAGTDPLGIGIESGSDIHIVNNEIYDFSSHPIQIGQSAYRTLPGFVIENNDIYFTSAIYNSDGTLMRAENTIELKGHGTRDNPIKILQNRLWGARWSDTSRCCIGGTAGAAINLSANLSGGSHVLVQNNILMENQIGIIWATGESSNHSIIGNIIYKTKRYLSSRESYALQAIKNQSGEIYLNTIINADNWAYLGSGLGDYDVHCNVMINGGSRTGGNGIDSGTNIAYNGFYNTSPSSTNNQNTVTSAIRYRQNSTSYSVGEIIATSDSSNCRTTNDSACFLYKVISTGVTANSPGSYCTALGCTTTDGTITAQAIRGPYAFFRKLLTAPEQYVIPYARVHSRAPEAYTCPTGYADRSGLGVSD